MHEPPQDIYPQLMIQGQEHGFHFPVSPVITQLPELSYTTMSGTKAQRCWPAHDIGQHTRTPRVLSLAKWMPTTGAAYSEFRIWLRRRPEHGYSAIVQYCSWCDPKSCPHPKHVLPNGDPASDGISGNREHDHCSSANCHGRTASGRMAEGGRSKKRVII